MTATPPSPTLTPSPSSAPQDEFIYGWRHQTVTLADGRVTTQKIPLTREAYLNPQEDDVAPENPFHARLSQSLYEMLTRWAKKYPTLMVFSELLIRWPGRPNAAPDVCLIPNVRDPGRDWSLVGSFDTATEGTAPSLVVEIVSPEYRKEDRVDKVLQYEQAGVPEYVIFDRRIQRGKVVEEVLGYRLTGKDYEPILPNEDGLILCPGAGLWFGLENGRLIVLDAETNEQLLTGDEWAARAAALEAELKRLRGESG